jgi:hypothetical protein
MLADAVGIQPVFEVTPFVCLAVALFVTHSLAEKGDA